MSVDRVIFDFRVSLVSLYHLIGLEGLNRLYERISQKRA